MSNFKDWFYGESLKIAELRKIYYELIEFDNKIDQLGLGDKMKDVDMNLYKARCAMAHPMLRMEEELKDACMKHMRRNKRRSETNENK